MANNNRRVDENTEAMLYQGASMSQICTLFSMDARDVKEKIKGKVMPVGVRAGHPIYSIKEIAAYLVVPPYDMDEFIQRMSIADLPTILRKEYWAGMRSRQLYEIAAATLWDEAEVIDTISELFKTIRLSLLLSREAVERETELTDRQRAIITRIIDNALGEAHAATTRRFAKAKAGAGETDTGREQHADSEEEL